MADREFEADDFVDNEHGSGEDDVLEAVYTCTPNEERFDQVFQHVLTQMMLLITDPYRAECFDFDRPITDQLAQLLAQLHRVCPRCGDEHAPACPGCGVELPNDTFHPELHIPDMDRPRIYNAYGRRLTYADADLAEDAKAMLQAMEGWCTDALINASRNHHKRGGRHRTADELRRYYPTVTEILIASGRSRTRRTRLSTWVNRKGMDMNAAIRRVQPMAAERAIEVLREEYELDLTASDDHLRRRSS